MSTDRKNDPLNVPDFDSYAEARKVIPSIKAGREHAAYEVGVSEGRKQSRDEVAALQQQVNDYEEERQALRAELARVRAEWLAEAHRRREYGQEMRSRAERAENERDEWREAFKTAERLVGKHRERADRAEAERDAMRDVVATSCRAADHPNCGTRDCDGACADEAVRAAKDYMAWQQDRAAQQEGE